MWGFRVSKLSLYDIRLAPGTPSPQYMVYSYRF